MLYSFLSRVAQVVIYYNVRIRSGGIQPIYTITSLSDEEDATEDIGRSHSSVTALGNTIARHNS